MLSLKLVVMIMHLQYEQHLWVSSELQEEGFGSPSDRNQRLWRRCLWGKACGEFPRCAVVLWNALQSKYSKLTVQQLKQLKQKHLLMSNNMKSCYVHDIATFHPKKRCPHDHLCNFWLRLTWSCDPSLSIEIHRISWADVTPHWDLPICNI